MSRNLRRPRKVRGDLGAPGDGIPDSAPCIHSGMEVLRILLGLVLLLPALGQDEEFKTRLSPSERMTRPHLEAAHRSATRFQRIRRPIPERSGFHDFRCILHAHAEDSTHTGGTRPEMCGDAVRAGVHGILLTDHFRPPRDFMDSWRFRTNGVLFIPGSEVRGFLVHPPRSILGAMQLPTDRFVEAVTQDDGMIFLSHIEERPDHPLDGLTGLEIYNRHYDAKQDFRGMLTLGLRMTDPDQAAELAALLKEFPDELLASQVQYPTAYLEKWDEGTRTRRLTGVAANDCHHNQVLIVKMVDADTVRVGTLVDKDESMQSISATLRPSIRRLTRGRNPGDILVRLDFDPYFRSFRNVSTHVLAPSLEEAALRRSLREGRAYVSHDWMCDPTGFQFETHGGWMGDEVAWHPGLELRARLPVPAQIRILRHGEEIASGHGTRFGVKAPGPGAYRVEAWLEIGGELRPWIYSNPIYLR
ncbi:MAG: histidinol phosphatase [Verrucomicrobiota bacterium]